MSAVKIYSITYRPKELKLSIKEFKKILLHDTVTDYYIGGENGEQGDKVAVNHYQCYVESTQNTSNLRRRLVEDLKIEDRHALKIIKTNDPEYTLGYVQKEHIVHRTNIDIDKLKKAETYYSEKKDMIDMIGDKQDVSFSSNDIFKHILDMHIQQHCSQFNQMIYAEYYRKYYKQINFSTISKLNYGQLRKHINIILGMNCFEQE